MAPAGSYAIGWDQVTLDGVAGAQMLACRAGVAWRWTGRALRLDGPPGVLRLGDTAEAVDLRRRARRGLGRFVAVPLAAPLDEGMLAGPAITVTDGRRSWRVDLLPARRGGRAIAHFPALLPPAGADLWIARVDGADQLGQAAATDRVWHGLAAGTMLAVPGGEVAVERIVPGMSVLTARGTVAEVVWTAARAVSGARLCVAPDLAPVRIAAGALGAGRPHVDLLLAPDQRIVLEGAQVRALYPQGQVVAAARDLAGGPGIAQVQGVVGMVAHAVVIAGGDAISVAGACLDGALPDVLRAFCPSVTDGLEGEGRRLLTRGEVAILRARAG